MENIRHSLNLGRPFQLLLKLTSLIISNTMTIEQQELIELKEIFFKRYSVRLTDEQATDVGMRLISLFQIIGKPFPEIDQTEKIKQNGSNA